MKGLFIPGITAEMFRSGCLESIEGLMSEDEIFNIDYDPRHIPAIRDKLWEIQQCSNCVLKPEKKIVEIKPQWTPVTEGLPKEDGHYIVTFKNGWLPNNVIPIDILRYAGGKWKYYFEFDNDGFEDDDFEDPITAWMPLPEPYKAKSEDKE